MHQLRVVRVRQLDAAQVQDVVGTVAGANGRDGAVGSDRQRSLVRHVDGAALIGQHRLAQRGLQQAVDADLQAAAPAPHPGRGPWSAWCPSGSCYRAWTPPSKRA
ncbi:hypothetical protein G6F60_015291 [Rhizopus arrhizus]|nr:hypothetical protein G6F60_015291 [Rhizopus arrhizus]